MCVLIIILVALVYSRKRQMSTFKRLGIPGPNPNFIFGNLIELNKEGMNRIFPKWTEKYGPIVGFYIGGRPQVMTTDPELIRRMFIKDFHLFADRNQCIPGGPHPTPELQQSIAWCSVDVWRHMRATVSPAFTSYKLNAMEPLMASKVDKLFGELNGIAESGAEVNLRSILSGLTFSIGVKCIFGLDYKLHTAEAKSLVDASKLRIDKSILVLIMILFPSLTFIAYPLRVLWERIRMYMQWSPEGVVYNIAKKIIQARRETKSQSVDFLQLLMNAKRVRWTNDSELEMVSEEVVKQNQNLRKKEAQSESLSEVEILANAMLFLLSSTETLSSALQFAVHNLVNDQSTQEQLRNELRELVGKDCRNVDFAVVSKVPLLNNIVKETLRMFPPASPSTTRIGTEDYKYGSITIPKGTPIFVGVSSIHKDPMVWTDPEKFQPDRFQRDFDKMSYLSFGLG